MQVVKAVPNSAMVMCRCHPTVLSLISEMVLKNLVDVALRDMDSGCSGGGLGLEPMILVAFSILDDFMSMQFWTS